LGNIATASPAPSQERGGEKYAATYGRYRLERIQQLGDRFTACGDYLQDVARIRCTNPECGLVGAEGTDQPISLKNILRHPAKMGRSPPGFDPNRLN
jgi:hypothetical protein